ncbi:uncharacterized protein LOC144427112 [Styela clava]
MDNGKSAPEDINKADPSQRRRLDGEIHDENGEQGLSNSCRKLPLVTVLKVSLILVGLGLILGLVIRHQLNKQELNKTHAALGKEKTKGDELKTDINRLKSAVNSFAKGTLT